MSTAWATVDLDAIEFNVRELAALVAPAEVCAVVKADGYGHGAVPVARAAVGAGAGWLAVAQVGEGETLRWAGIEAPVLVLAEPIETQLARVVDARLSVTVCTRAVIESAQQAAARAGAVIPVHLKVDTGMNRIGVAPAEALELARLVAAAPNLELEAVWTHLAVADEPVDPFSEVQLVRYRAVLDELEAAGIRPRLRHAANSAGAIAHPEARFDMVRCGIAVYGIAPSPELAGKVELRPAMSVAARVTFVKRVPAGEGISYGLRHRFAAATTVATASIGYADGVRRDLYARGAEVLVGGHRRPIVGTVTMDQIMVDCGDLDVRVGDDVVLLGRQGNEEVSVEEWAERTETIPYEVVCGFGPRVERRWVRGGPC